jgi:hypothetical protein
MPYCVLQGKPKEAEGVADSLAPGSHKQQQQQNGKQPGSTGVWRLLGARSPALGQENEEEELFVETSKGSHNKTSLSFTCGSSSLGGKPPLVPSSLRTASVTAMPGYSLGPTGWQPYVEAQQLSTNGRGGSNGGTASPAPNSFFKDDMQRRGKGSSLVMAAGAGGTPASRTRPVSVLGISSGSHQLHSVYQQIGGDVITTEGGLPHRAYLVPHPQAPIPSPTASSNAGGTGGLTSPHLTSPLGSIPGTPAGANGSTYGEGRGGTLAGGVDPLMVNPTRGSPGGSVTSYEQHTAAQTPVVLPPPPPSSSLGTRSSVGTPTPPAPPSSSHKLRRNSVPAELLASFQASMSPAGHITPTGV